MDQKHFVEAVTKGLSDRTIVPFIGAGFAHYGGYPLWSELLQHILDNARKEDETFLKSCDKKTQAVLEKKIAKNNLQAVADYIAEHTSQCRRLLIKAASTIRRKAYKKQLGLEKWNCPIVLTTNFDEYIEELLTTNSKLYTSFTHEQAPAFSQLKSNTTNIVHLHGTLSDPKSIVFSTNDIKEKILVNEVLRQTLSALLSDKSLLFLGYGLNDPYFTELLKYLSQVYGDISAEHFGVLECTSVDAEVYKKNLSLNVLEVESFKETPNALSDAIMAINSSLEKRRVHLEASAGSNREDLGSHERRIELISKFTHLAAIQKVHLEKRALLPLIVRKGLEIIGKKNKTFNIHLVIGDYMVVVVEGGENANKRKPEKVKPLTSGLIGRVYRENLAINAPNVADYEEYDDANGTTASELIIPLVDKNQNVVGVLNVESSCVGDFSAEDEAILKVVAAQVSIAIENKRRYDNMNAALCIANAIPIRPNFKRGRKLQTAFRNLLEKTVPQLGFERACLLYRNSPKRTFEPVSYGFSREEVSSFNSGVEATLIRIHSQSIVSDHQVVDDKKAIETEACLTVGTGGECELVISLRTSEALILSGVEKDLLGEYTMRLHRFYGTWILEKEEHKEKAEARVLERLHASFESFDSERAVLENAAKVICEELEIDWCFIHMKDPILSYTDCPEDGSTIFSLKTIAGGIEKEELLKWDYKIGEGLTGLVAKERREIRSENVAGDSRSTGENKDPFEVRSVEILAFLGVPIRDYTKLSKIGVPIDQDVLGVLSVLRRRNDEMDDRGFTREEAEFMKRTATMLGRQLCLKLSRVEMQDYDNCVGLLEAAGSRLKDCHTEDEVFSALQDLVSVYLREQHFSVFRLDEDAGLLQMVAPKKLIGKNRLTFGVGKGLTGGILTRSKERTIFTIDLGEGLDSCREFWRRVVGTDERYFLGTPIRHPSGNGFYGVLTLNGRRHREFSPTFYESTVARVVSALAAFITGALKDS